MSALPFRLSADAAFWIPESVARARKIPKFLDLRPALCFSMTYYSSEPGREEYYHGEHFLIGWYRPEELAVQGVVEVELVGVKVAIWPETLKRLEGKQLVLETVEVGFPNLADKRTQMLRARI